MPRTETRRIARRSCSVGLRSSIIRLTARWVGTEKAHRIIHQVRRLELSAQVAAEHGNRVQHGPFSGMLLPDRSSWMEGDRAAKLLGLYERELHPAVRSACDRSPETVINVGCADGYYAIGLARLLPNARVFAFDADLKARRVCAAAAAANGVADRIRVAGSASCESLAELVRPGSSGLMVMDCEGCEATILDPQRLPGLSAYDIIVETHDCFVPRVTENLMERFRATHEVELIRAGARDPAALLPHWSESDRWTVVDEARQAGTNWLACWSRVRCAQDTRGRGARRGAPGPSAAVPQ